MALLNSVESLKANPPAQDWDGSLQIEKVVVKGRSLGWREAGRLARRGQLPDRAAERRAVARGGQLRRPYFQIELITAAAPIAVNATITGG